MTEHIIKLPNQWITADKLEEVLRPLAEPKILQSAGITFCFPPSAKVMVEAAVRLLSFANQLADGEVSVTIEFQGEQNNAMEYLNRANFFSVLSEQVHVIPVRPHPAYARRYYGKSKHLIEFTSIGTNYNEEQMHAIPTKLVDALEAAMETRADRVQFGHIAFTIFTELITNVYVHSQTRLDGFAALQVYPQGGKVQVVVSDSGIGLLETFKPKILTTAAKNITDAELIRQIFHGDLVWDRKDKGMGLEACARQALKYQGCVDIRLATYNVNLTPSSDGYEAGNVKCQRDLAPIKGTHICFSFPLDISS